MFEIQSQPAILANYNDIRRVEGYEAICASHPAYLTDESKFYTRSFDYLFLPKNESELAAVVKEMGSRGIKITVAGARTGLVGGCVPDQGALASLEHFNSIEALYYDAATAEWRLRAQCAVSLRTIAAQVAIRSFPDIEQCTNKMNCSEINRFCNEPDSYFYPPDPTEMSASLGGTVATNASGARTFRYGPTRDWVRGLRVMMANGEILDVPRGKYFASPSGEFTITDSKGGDFRFKIPTYCMPRTKNVSGIFSAPHMDLVDLFIGSEGVFGIITEVTVALIKRGPKISIVQFLNSDDQAIELVEGLRTESRLRLDFLEFYSGHALALLKNRQKQDPIAVGTPIIPETAGAALFFELDFNPNDRFVHMDALNAVIKANGASLADSWVAYENREIDRLKGFRHILPETINSLIAERKKSHPGLHKLGTDFAVPDESFRDIWIFYREVLDSAGLEWTAFGHIGNSHVHINIMPRDMNDLEKGLILYQKFARKAVELKGTVSAEHGIGKLKIKFLQTMYSLTDIQQMKAIKKALDPERLLNPGTIFND